MPLGVLQWQRTKKNQGRTTARSNQPWLSNQFLFLKDYGKLFCLLYYQSWKQSLCNSSSQFVLLLRRLCFIFIRILSGNMKLQKSVIPWRLCWMGLLTFSPELLRPDSTPFLVFGLYDEHESGFLFLKLCLQDKISLLPLCHCQFTMCLTIQTRYYKPLSYKKFQK